MPFRGISKLQVLQDDKKRFNVLGCGKEGIKCLDSSLSMNLSIKPIFEQFIFNILIVPV